VLIAHVPVQLLVSSIALHNLLVAGLSLAFTRAARDHLIRIPFDWATKVSAAVLAMTNLSHCHLLWFSQRRFELRDAGLERLRFSPKRGDHSI
jgi:hypothetical protein